jgi:hypothetical protein
VSTVEYEAKINRKSATSMNEIRRIL